VLHGARVAGRLVRDAAALGLGDFTQAEVEALLVETGRERFGRGGEGVVRLEARPGSALGSSARGGVLLPDTRPLGPEPERWRAIVPPLVHPGPGPVLGVKRTGVAAFAAAREAARAAGVDETLLFDAAGRLVEGARTNVFVATADGRFCMPPLERGAVRGVALDVIVAAGVLLEARDLGREDCAAAREIVATNSVRGAHAIVELDGRTVGNGAPGALHAALAEALR
jgi:branched-subunit amino acid aminotransferase/4-amino-4-deoxychorismate lyase